MGYLGNIKIQYFIRFFSSLIPAYVIERLFWQARGMDVQMVVYCHIIYSLAIVLMEVPSGILADRFGRKPLIVISYVLAVIEIVILLFAHSFWMFALAMAGTGTGSALFSGANNALLYDSLLAGGKQGEFEKLLGRLSAVDFAGHVIAMLSGGLLADKMGFELNYMISIGSMGIAFLFTLLLKEPPMVTKAERGAISQVKQAMSLFKKQPLVLIYCASGMLLGACLAQLDEFWQLVMEGIGIPVALFGLVGALLTASRVPGNLLAYKLKERFSYQAILNAIFLVNILGYVTIFFTRSAWNLIPVALVSLVAGIAEPLVMGYLHHRTESRYRATAESFASLGLQGMSVLAGLVFGFVSVRFSIFAGFLPLAVICAAWLIVFQFQKSVSPDSHAASGTHPPA